VGAVAPVDFEILINLFMPSYSDLGVGWLFDSCLRSDCVENYFLIMN
jgi:hypothetical protein